MNAERAKRRLSAILSADVKDYSRLMGENELGTVETLKKYRVILAEFIGDYGGRVIDSPGDNILAEFTSVVDAVECSISIQEELKRQNSELLENRRMEFRIGINLGDVIEDREQIYGDGVNIAARIESLAEAGGICISGTAYDQIENKLPLRYDYLGEQKVKNITRPIRVYSASKEIAAIGNQPATLPQKNRWRMIVATLVLMLAGMMIIWYWRSRQPSKPFPINPSIAVLPFLDMSPEKDQEYFADGLTEELLNVLSKIPELQVVGRTSSFQFKGKNEDLRLIGQKLNVSTIMEGSVRKEGRRVRITAQLINTGDGFHIWSETYDHELDDIFIVQEEIARSVAGALKLTLLSEKIFSLQTRNSQAYNAYLLGQYFLGRRGKEDLEKAIDYYNQAIKYDTNYAQAWVGLAVTRLRLADWGYVPVEEGYREARKELQQALSLDPSLAIAHSVLGRIKMQYDWDWVGADASFKQALALEPGNTGVMGNAAALYACLGRLEEALVLERQSVVRDPLSVAAHYNHAVYFYYGNYPEEAAAAARKALELRPESPALHLTLGLIYLSQSLPQMALEEMERETDTGWRLYGLALAYHPLGRKMESDAALMDLIAGFQFDSAFQIAAVYAFRNEADRAFEWLERAYAQRDSGLPFVKVDPMLKSLKSDPRYTAFLKKMRLDF